MIYNACAAAIPGFVTEMIMDQALAFSDAL
jgi:hypothetical protein